MKQNWCKQKHVKKCKRTHLLFVKLIKCRGCTKEMRWNLVTKRESCQVMFGVWVKIIYFSACELLIELSNWKAWWHGHLFFSDVFSSFLGCVEFMFACGRLSVDCGGSFCFRCPVPISSPWEEMTATAQLSREKQKEDSHFLKNDFETMP